MRIINQSFNILTPIDPGALRFIEQVGRVCYKSENLITDDSAAGFVQRILQSGHESVIEHLSVSVRVICDRGVSHEIVRHRIASYSQESTRYCNYGKEKFGGEITFIKPVFSFEDTDPRYLTWCTAMQNAENSYLSLLNAGATPEEARSVLPNSLKTELIMTMNLREWRHFFRLRCSPKAHPQMRALAVAMREAFQQMIPFIFDA
jgi:thymidylate synthase (FAD)